MKSKTIRKIQIACIIGITFMAAISAALGIFALTQEHWRAACWNFGTMFWNIFLVGFNARMLIHNDRMTKVDGIPLGVNMTRGYDE